QAVDSDDEDDFPAYEVPESEKNFEVVPDGAEPERKATAPYYIRDCYEQLSEKEKYEVFEAAFFALNEMIRRKAIGFVDIASSLAKKLVYLEDKFSTKDFENVRKQCLISCLVMRPEIAPKLARLIYCVSDILQKAANAPTVVKMATSLADVVAPLKFHPDAFVRSSVLFAYFSITLAVPDGVFFELFGNVVRGWIEWSTMCADDVDSSDQQRKIAGAIRCENEAADLVKFTVLALLLLISFLSQQKLAKFSSVVLS
ncbi:hypothetical protein GCK32_013756, partial [Trichostrongylus colubriformis]